MSKKPAAPAKRRPSEVPRPSNDGTARRLLNGRRLVFYHTAGQAWQFDEQRFGRFAAFAAECGATHAQVSLPFRYNSWVLPDNHDPYASWCVKTFLANPGRGLRHRLDLKE